MNTEKLPRSFDVFFDNKDGKRIEASVETRDLNGKPDCRIGHFGENWWIRTNKALKKDWQGYGSLEKYKQAVKLSLFKRGFKKISFEK